MKSKIVIYIFFFFLNCSIWHLTNFHPLYRGTDKHLHLFILMCTRFTNNILFINIINTIYTGLFVIWYRLTSAKTNFWFSQASLFWFHRLTLFCSEVDSWIKCKMHIFNECENVLRISECVAILICSNGCNGSIFFSYVLNIFKLCEYIPSNVSSGLNEVIR